MPKRERPNIILRKDKRGPVPASPFDAEQYDALPLGTEFDVKPRTRRSNDQLRYYWAVLSKVVAATGIAPSAPHLHDLVKADLGYVTPVRLLNGALTFWPDSVALDAMEPAVFTEFMDKAFARLAEVTGIDPAELTPDQAREAA